MRTTSPRRCNQETETKTATTRMMKSRGTLPMETPRTMTSEDAKSETTRYTTRQYDPVSTINIRVTAPTSARLQSPAHEHCPPRNDTIFPQQGAAKVQGERRAGCGERALADPPERNLRPRGSEGPNPNTKKAALGSLMFLKDNDCLQVICYLQFDVLH
jgi:hypothetical protein